MHLFLRILGHKRGSDIMEGGIMEVRVYIPNSVISSLWQPKCNDIKEFL